MGHCVGPCVTSVLPEDSAPGGFQAPIHPKLNPPAPLAGGSGSPRDKLLGGVAGRALNCNGNVMLQPQLVLKVLKAVLML